MIITCIQKGKRHLDNRYFFPLMEGTEETLLEFNDLVQHIDPYTNYILFVLQIIEGCYWDILMLS